MPQPQKKQLVKGRFNISRIVFLPGAGWSVLGASTAQVIRIIAFASLAPILGPAPYGLIGIATIISAPFNLLLINGGWFESVMREPKINRNELNSLYWFHIAIGAAAISVFVLFSPILENRFASKDLGTVLLLLAINPLLQGLSIVPRTLLFRELKFKSLAAIDISSTGLGLVIATILAVNNYGVYSLVALQISINLCTAVLLVSKTKYYPAPRFKFNEIRIFFSVSKSFLTINTTRMLEQLAIRLLIGATFGITTLGNYVFVRRIFEIISLGTISAINRVGLTHLSNTQSITDKVTISKHALLYGIALTWPIFLFLILAGETYITPWVGDEWSQGVSLLFWICLSGLTLPAQRAMTQLMLTFKRESWITIVEVSWSLAALLCIFILSNSEFQIELILQVLFMKNVMSILSLALLIYLELKERHSK